MADERDRDGAKNQIKGMGNELRGRLERRGRGRAIPVSRSSGKAQELKRGAQKIGEAQSDSDIDINRTSFLSSKPRGDGISRRRYSCGRHRFVIRVTRDVHRAIKVSSSRSHGAITELK
jgi:hypothetical protein